MERNWLLEERVTALPERALTGPLFTVGAGIQQGNGAVAGGNTCLAGCPSIIIQLNVAVVIQMAMGRGGRGR
ncbi:MAG: hypothetical protein NZ761_07820 [Dehalococcoidia bacterium]|nr:hypothetical protein [Thermomicrobium sp.]MCS7295291.1 hypothetical protein [Dehalococcoidia bacterium]MCX7622739.1 hypothetical protein [Thermomicrobium sp.]